MVRCDPGRPIRLTYARVSSFVLGCRSNLVDKGKKGNLWESIGQLKGKLTFACLHVALI